VRTPPLFDRLSRNVRAKVESFEESGMGYWRVRATLHDGRTFRNVYITDLFTLGFPDLTPFRLRDIADVEWDGYRGSESSGVPIEITR
jgi:hypothetical protein